MLCEIDLQVLLGPITQRVDLQPSVLDLEPGQILPRDGLESLPSRNPGIQALLGARQWFHLADVAASVRVERPAQALFIPCGKHIWIGRYDTAVGKAKAGD